MIMKFKLFKLFTQSLLPFPFHDLFTLLGLHVIKFPLLHHFTFLRLFQWYLVLLFLFISLSYSLRISRSRSLFFIDCNLDFILFSLCSISSRSPWSIFDRNFLSCNSFCSSSISFSLYSSKNW